MATLIDGVIFTADFSGEWESEKHPRDAHGHFMQSTAGSGELRALLQAAPTDPLARSAAADHLEESGRQQEADLLRHSKHPLVAIGGGVFESSGILDEIGPQSLVLLTHRPTHLARLTQGSGRTKDVDGNHRAIIMANGLAHAIHVPEGDSGTTSDYGRNRLSYPLSEAESPRRRLRGNDAKVNKLLARLMQHQMEGEQGDMIALTPSEEKLLGNYIKKHAEKESAPLSRPIARTLGDPELRAGPVVDADRALQELKKTWHASDAATALQDHPDFLHRHQEASRSRALDSSLILDDVMKHLRAHGWRPSGQNVRGHPFVWHLKNQLQRRGMREAGLLGDYGSFSSRRHLEAARRNLGDMIATIAKTQTPSAQGDNS